MFGWIDNEMLTIRSSMTIGYLREQLCLVQRNGPVMQEPSVEHWPGNYITEQLPRVSIYTCGCPCEMLSSVSSSFSAEYDLQME